MTGQGLHQAYSDTASPANIGPSETHQVRIGECFERPADRLVRHGHIRGHVQLFRLLVVEQDEDMLTEILFNSSVVQTLQDVHKYRPGAKTAKRNQDVAWRTKRSGRVCESRTGLVLLLVVEYKPAMWKADAFDFV